MSASETQQTAQPTNEELTFEEARDRLESVTTELESGDLGLAAALERFEEGVRLLRHCTLQLDDAEARIEILLREHDQLRTEPVELEL